MKVALIFFCFISCFMIGILFGQSSDSLDCHTIFETIPADPCKGWVTFKFYCPVDSLWLSCHDPDVRPITCLKPLMWTRREFKHHFEKSATYSIIVYCTDGLIAGGFYFFVREIPDKQKSR